MLRAETIYQLHRATAARYRCQQSAGFSSLMESVRWWAAIELEIRHIIDATEDEMTVWRLFLANVGDLHGEPMRRLGQSILALILIERLDLYQATAHALAVAETDT
jgi:hypothetical protein